MQKTPWQCRVAPSLGELESTHEIVWGTIPYIDDQRPTVFFGLYGLPDFYALWRHKGEKHILWAGSDIRHFKSGYWLDDSGSIRLNSYSLAQWINKNCTSWCENDVEAKALAECGIYAKVQPSFLGDIDDFLLPYSFRDSNEVYSSVSGNNFDLYGWDKINDLAKANPGLSFHLYGNTIPWEPKSSKARNIKVHGRVPKDRMNSEIENMGCGIRMTEFDGFSEILAKSVLWGQWPVSLIEYPYILRPDQLSEIVNKRKPNIEGRDYYRRILNDYPWNTKKYEADENNTDRSCKGAFDGKAEVQ